MLEIKQNLIIFIKNTIFKLRYKSIIIFININ